MVKLVIRFSLAFTATELILRQAQDDGGLRSNLRAEDFVVDFAGAEEREGVDAADFVEAHDAAKAGFGEEGVGVGELEVGGGEKHDAAAGGCLDAFDRDLRARVARRIG